MIVAAVRAARVLAGMLVCAAGSAMAQTSADQDAVFRRAEQLATAGDSAAAFALADSLARAAPPGTAAHADALYWRARFAPGTAAARLDYLVVIIEYPLLPRAADALLKLGQLAATTDRAAASVYLERLVLEHAATKAAAEGWVLLGRVRLADGNLRGACAALDSAQARLPATAVEQRNQLGFTARPCRTLAPDTVAAPPGAPAVAPPAPDAREPGAAANAGPRWSAQVAAFRTRREAETLAGQLRSRGYAEARVDSLKLFHVRIGMFATRREAAALVTTLKRARMDAMVVEAIRRDP